MCCKTALVRANRYQELAELAVRWTRAQSGQAAAAPSAAAGPRAPLLDQMAQELYRVVLFAVFYLQVCLLGVVPYVGETSGWISVDPRVSYKEYLVCIGITMGTRNTLVILILAQGLHALIVILILSVLDGNTIWPLGKGGAAVKNIKTLC